MTQHTGDNLNRYAVGKSEARKGMTRDMHCQRFVNAAYAGNLSEIGVHTLIRYHRKNDILFLTNGMPFILLGDETCRFQIWDAAYILCFLTNLVDPVVPIVINGDMLRFKTFDIRERQPGQCAEYENIPYYIQPLKGECLVHYYVEFLLSKELTVCSLGMETYSLKWIDVHPFVV